MGWLRVIVPAILAAIIPVAVMFILLAWVVISYVRGRGWFDWLLRAVTGR